MSDTIVLLYVGKSAGPFSVYGAQTKREYRVNGLGATLSVDERDAPVLAAMREFEPIEIAPAADRPDSDPPSDSDSEGQDSADSTSSPTEPVNATDAAIALADEAGIDLAAVAGTGADGRIVINDVRDAIAAQA